MSDYIDTIKEIVSRNTGISASEMSENAEIPLAHRDMIIMEVSVATGAAFFFHHMKDLTIGKLGEEVNKSLGL